MKELKAKETQKDSQSGSTFLEIMIEVFVHLTNH